MAYGQILSAKLLNIYFYFSYKGGDIMTYMEFIEDIIKTRGRHGCGDVYHEKHHIKPRCLGGLNKEDNYVDLYGREHFIAHKLLADENPKNKKLQYAWWCMSSMEHRFTKERYKCTPEEFEEARIAMSKCVKIDQSGKYVSDETKKKLSKSRKGMRLSEETKQKIGAAASGEKNPFYGKTHSEETKRKMSRPVLCIETNVAYYGATEAHKLTGIDLSDISKCCKGKLKSAGKHPITGERLHWTFVDQ